MYLSVFSYHSLIIFPLSLPSILQIVKKMMDLGTVKKKLERGQYSNAAECAADIRLIWDNCKLYNQQGSDFHLLAESFSRRFEDRYKKVCAEYDTGEGAATGGKVGKKSPAPGAGGGAKSSRGRGSSMSPTPSGPITLDARVALGAKIFKLSGMELGHVSFHKFDACLSKCPLLSPSWLHVRMSRPTLCGHSSHIHFLSSPCIYQPTSILQAINIIELRCPEALVGCGGVGTDNDGLRTDELEIDIDALDSRTFNEVSRYVSEALSNGGRTSVADDYSRGVGGSRGRTNSRASSTAAVEEDNDDDEEEEFQFEEEEEEEDEEVIVEAEEVEPEWDDEDEEEVIVKHQTKKRRKSN